MTFAEKILLSLYESGDGDKIDIAYSGNEERYREYKLASLKDVHLTKFGNEFIERLKMG